MNVLDLIEHQRIVNQKPMVAVTLAAVPHANTPVILALHWHGFVEVPLIAGGQTVLFEPIQSSILQVNAPWNRCEDLDNALLEAAWEMGAWNVERIQAAPHGRPGANQAETTAARNAFGLADGFADGFAGHRSPYMAEAPDADDLVDAAARSGYVHWLFRPVMGGVWPATLDDVTLESGGYRNPSCPQVSKPIIDARDRRTALREVYPLGKSGKFLH